MTITIIDYGSGNMLSVLRAFEQCGAVCQISNDPTIVAESDALVLPGVGAFRDGMEGLSANGLIEPIKIHALAGRPLLGICLGMQMLANYSEEFGTYPGLGLIPGKVSKLSSNNTAGTQRKIPFIGWASIDCPSNGSWRGTPLQSVETGESIYLVHSYHFEQYEASDLLATYNLHGDIITAAVRRTNITGLQFHPEKSGPVGLKILREFVKISNNL